jgi:hypothetical protein
MNVRENGKADPTPSGAIAIKKMMAPSTPTVNFSRRYQANPHSSGV